MSENPTEMSLMQQLQQAQKDLLKVENELEKERELAKEIIIVLGKLVYAVKSEPVMNHQKYDALGIEVYNAIDKYADGQSNV